MLDPQERAEGEGLHEDIGGGQTLTVNETNAPSNPGGYYQSQSNGEGQHVTQVFDSSGNEIAEK